MNTISMRDESVARNHGEWTHDENQWPHIKIPGASRQTRNVVGLIS
jgi:hypothetical protein